MSRAEKDIERLIVRCLDGELSENEQLDLDRELIRDPETRRMLEDYRRVDELAAEALDQELGDDIAAPNIPVAPPSEDRRPPVHRYHRGWWLVSGAVAAALLAVVVARYPAPSIDRPAIVQSDPGIQTQVVPLSPAARQPGDNMTAVGTGGRRIRRDTGREVFGVLGEDGNLYWIEVDRTLTVRQPKRTSGIGFTSEEM